jgi:lon-related putative ATP-dependent protease
VSAARRLEAAELFRRCDPSTLPFETTGELEPLDRALGQERALEAMHLATGLDRDGYNVYALGAAGLGRHTVVQRFLEERAAAREVPPDWCYVHNFKTPHRPRVLELPAGAGQRLREDMARCVEDLLLAIPTIFQSDEYRERAQALAKTFSDREEKAFEALAEKAQSQGIAMLRTPAGYTLAPIVDDKVLGPREYSKLPEQEQKRIEAVVGALKEELKDVLGKLPGWQRESQEELRKLNREMIERAVSGFFDELERRYASFEQVVEYLRAVREDVVDNVDAFRPEGESTVPENTRRRVEEFPQYAINVMVDNGETHGAPVIYEDNPNYTNLVGRIEHVAHLGALSTNFMLIKPGALHRANGGYLVLDAVHVLSSPFAWHALKRALRSRELRIESLERLMSLLSTISLEPEPIPLDVKVVLVGDRLLYYLVRELDQEFAMHFKVAADFTEELDRDDDSAVLYARLVAMLIADDELRAFDRGAVARVIEQCARRVEDAKKLSLHVGSLLDLLRESDWQAAEAGADTVTAEHVQRAIDAAIRRLDQLRERVHEQILRGIHLVDTDGEAPAQVNGLSVYHLDESSFGIPTRITATARLGSGEVVDIEREVELGGNIHSKGVMILSAFLAARYARDEPLALAATLVFEQSYGGVEGDSASAAELCALLSALSGLPLRQSLAITGSVNQRGQVQAIGGVNDKVEGFFDICSARGLSGEQGVILPASNVQHLMLRRDVVEAVEQGRFAIYAVSTVDEAVSLLTGVPAGEPDEQGAYPPDSVNGRVQARVAELNALRKLHAAQEHEDEGNGDP